MSSAPVLDTRSPYQTRSTQPHMTITATSSQTGSPGLTLFNRAVHDLIRSSHQDRSTCRTKVINRLRSARDPIAYINELIDECAVKGGSDGLDIGIDVLSQFGEHVFQYAWEFLKKDYERWCDTQEVPRHHFNDDAWYILLRAAAQSDLEPWQKFHMVLYSLESGTESIQEASIRALGDIGGDGALDILRETLQGNPSPSVRQAIIEVLDDLEG
ncbi:HEAT repeat domain-containing protein [Singulisphaera sp. PoT]|uniref:HEAT repeat domain-containing protein n=1 Tax=Singulisphaera sp. PoT TaxID=3411797 RepID=UPI003BF5288B